MLIKGKRGQALLMASFVVAFALVIAALVLDLGRMWVIRARLQTAADAATLAAVQHTRVAVKKEAQPLLATDFFKVGDTLPPSQDIVEKNPRYETETYYTTDSQGNKHRHTRQVLVGWDVTWIVGYKEGVKNYWAELDPAEALAEAQNVLYANAWHWVTADQSNQVVIPQIESASADAEGTRSTCKLTVAGRVESLLIGPVLKLFGRGNGSNPEITVRVSSESSANISAK